VHSGSGRCGAFADKKRVVRNVRAASQLLVFVAIVTACHGLFFLPLDFIPVLRALFGELQRSV
jgi:hypothetical protein